MAKKTGKELVVIGKRIVRKDTGKTLAKDDISTAIDGLRKSELQRETNKSIERRIQDIETEIEVNQELKEKAINKVAEKKVIEKLEYDYDKENIKQFPDLQDFLNLQRSEHTRNNYQKSITDFFTWCFKERIDYLRITRKEAESYLVSLSNKYAPNSVRTKILSIGSYYNFLLYRHTKVLRVNPFSKIKLPRIIPSRRIDVVTDNDIKELKKELKRIKREDILCAVDLLCKYGFRVGIFNKMKIDREGNWNSVSKERSMKGKFLKNEVQRINESGILKLKGYTITNTIVKYTKKLAKERKIGSAFSPHDIRHYYITKYGKDLSMGDFIRFSRGIHKNVNTTLGYMNIK